MLAEELAPLSELDEQFCQTVSELDLGALMRRFAWMGTAARRVNAPGCSTPSWPRASITLKTAVEDRLRQSSGGRGV